MTSNIPTIIRNHRSGRSLTDLKAPSDEVIKYQSAAADSSATQYLLPKKGTIPLVPRQGTTKSRRQK